MERAAEEMDAAVREQMEAAATPAGVDGAPSVSSAVEAAVKAVEVVMDAVEAEEAAVAHKAAAADEAARRREEETAKAVWMAKRAGERAAAAKVRAQRAAAARAQAAKEWAERAAAEREAAARAAAERSAASRLAERRRRRREGSRSHPAETLRRADARGSEDAAEAEAAEDEVHAETPWEAHRRRRFDSAARERDEALAVLAKRALADSARLRARLEAVDRRSPPTTGRGATALDRGAASRHADSLDSLPSVRRAIEAEGGGEEAAAAAAAIAEANDLVATLREAKAAASTPSPTAPYRAVREQETVGETHGGGMRADDASRAPR